MNGNATSGHRRKWLPTRPGWVFVLWALVATAFGTVYWLYWVVTPDAFILNKELNVEPLRDLVRIVVDDPSRPGLSLPADDVDPLSADDLSPMAKGARSRIATLRARQTDLVTANTRVSFLNGQVKQLFAALDVDRGREIEAYKAEAVEPFVEPIKQREAEVARLEAETRAKPTDSGMAVSLAKARVSLAQEQYAQAVAASDAATYVLANMGKFGAGALQAQASEIYKQQIAALAKVDAADAAERGARADIRDYLDQQTRLRMVRLDWIDFVYFSFGVSTSNAFGDITPNSRSVRALVLLQIVLSMGIVALFFERLFTARRSV